MRKRLSEKEKEKRRTHTKLLMWVFSKRENEGGEGIWTHRIKGVNYLFSFSRTPRDYKYELFFQLNKNKVNEKDIIKNNSKCKTDAN